MLIGLCGAPGCGKDTLAEQFILHDVYERYRMADPIKRMLREFHIRDDVWEDPVQKERDIPWLGRSPRYLAQTLGTEWGRNCVRDDIWVLLAKGRWHHLNAGGKGRMVIPDIRFENEARWLREEGGLLLQIVRPDNQKVMDNPGHASEWGFPESLIDDQVFNTGTKEELRDRAWERIHVQIQ